MQPTREGVGMRKLALSVAIVALVSASPMVLAQNGFISEALQGLAEVPAVSTGASGGFVAIISAGDSRIDWALRYSALEGDVQQAHIHLGNVGVNGGITVFLCTNLGNGPAGTQACP